MAESGIHITFDDVKNMLGRQKEIARHNVLVGIPDKTAGRTDGPASNAVIGYVQEHGNAKLNIPPRPFLKPGTEAILDQAVKMLRQAAIFALEGKRADYKNQLNALGLIGAASVKKAIVNGAFIPLAPRTLLARRLRGVTRTKPLIDTGRLLQAITYVVRRKGGAGSESTWNGTGTFGPPRRDAQWRS